MCGICGIAGFEDKDLVRRMCDVISHRGPDDSGFYFDSGIGLGHRRLSIIDLSGGRQPMHNEDESVWIVYNGEVYNHHELRDFLEKKGHRFCTSSDTEAIIHLYEELGDYCVQELRGMFAFALWDSNKRKLLLARDRIGKKPLYYAFSGDALIFSSEIKSILEHSGIPRRVNERAFHTYLAFQCTFGTDTMFEGIKKLLPGHILTYKKDAEQLVVSPYWNMKMEAVHNKNEEYYIKNFEKLLRESVELRLMSDVPLGAYLSGGLDSSSVVGIMSSLMNEPVKTFTVGFGEADDELGYARMVSEHFKTEHQEFIFDSRDVIKALPDIVWHFDEPLADGGAIPTYLMSEQAKKKVKVILVGEGADEGFAGYSNHKLMSPYFGVIPRAIKLRAYYYLNTFVRDNNEYKKFLCIFSENNRTQNLLNQTLLFELNNTLPNSLLMKVDKTTMAHSIEARAPFLDHKLLEFSGTIPVDMKLRGLTGKYIIRKAMSHILPEKIIGRKKHGFLVPINTWLKNELGEYAANEFSEPSEFTLTHIGDEDIRKLFKPQNNKLRQMENNVRLWRLLIFEIWYNIFKLGED